MKHLENAAEFEANVASDDPSDPFSRKLNCGVPTSPLGWNPEPQV
jgi:hypothetical protein